MLRKILIRLIMGKRLNYVKKVGKIRNSFASHFILTALISEFETKNSQYDVLLRQMNPDNKGHCGHLIGTAATILRVLESVNKYHDEYIKINDPKQKKEEKSGFQPE